MIKPTPKNVRIVTLWEDRRALLERVRLHNEAIAALQKLCQHCDEVNVSRRGSPDMECPDCGKGMLP